MNERQDPRRHRQLERQVLLVAEPELEPRAEPEDEDAVNDRHVPDAGSEADAATTMVYSIAPASSRTFTTCAMEERFCPIAL